MKKLITLAFILIFLSGIFTSLPETAASGRLTFRVGRSGQTYSATQGSSISIPITVTNNEGEGFAAVGLSVSFDRSVLELTGVRALVDELPLNRFSINTGEGPQWISLIEFSNPVEWTKDGDILSMTFRVLDNAPVGSSTITLAFTGPASPDGNPATTRTLPGNALPGGVFRDAIPIEGNVIISASSDNPIGPRPPDHFGVTIGNPGAGSDGAGWYLPGAEVTIIAGTAPQGQQFSHWVAPAGVTLANPNSATTTFSMPSSDVTVTANWVPTGGVTPTPTPSPTPSPTPPPGEPSPSPSPSPPPGTETPTPPPGGVTPPPGGGTTPTPPPGGTTPTPTPTPSPSPNPGRPTPTPTPGSGSGEPGQNPSGPGFGQVPQTSVADISGTVLIMWGSIIMAVGFAISLYFHIKSNKKRSKQNSYHYGE